MQSHRLTVFRAKERFDMGGELDGLSGLWHAPTLHPTEVGLRRHFLDHIDPKRLESVAAIFSAIANPGVLP
jgi:hypothetical protein